eukprot:gene5275-5327_t
MTALRRYQILDTGADPAFDRITAMAADWFGKRASMITFMDEGRLWIKSAHGASAAAHQRFTTICDDTICQLGVFVVSDLWATSNYSERSIPGLHYPMRFYAAAPLLTQEGYALGTLCLLDDRPDEGFSLAQQARLQSFAALVMDLLERKRAHDEENDAKAEIALIRDIHLVLTERLSFSATIDRILHRLLDAFDAYACRVWECRDGEDTATMISLACMDPITKGHPEAVDSRVVNIRDLVTAELFEAENRTMWHVIGPADHDHPRLGPAISAGIGSLVGCSLQLADRRFVLAMTFKGVRQDLPERSELLGRLVLAIRPILQRRLDDERTTLLSAALEATQDAVIIAEITGEAAHNHRIVYVNGALLAQTGYSVEELSGQPLAIFNVPGEDLPEVERIKSAMRRGEPVRTMLQRRRRDGSNFWAETTFVPLFDASGVATHRVGIMRDMTQQRAEAEDLRERERALLETTAKLEKLTGELIETQRIAKLGTFRRPVESDAFEWSDSVYKMFGVQKDSFVPTKATILERIHPEDREILRSRLAVPGQEPVSYTVVYRTVGEDGTVRYVSNETKCEVGPDGTVTAVVGIVLDVTEQRQAQAMLLQTEKLRSIGQLTGGIAHDFNNLLTVISVNLEMLGDTLGPGHPAEELRAMAFRAAEHGAQLTSSLLAFARRQSLQPEPNQVNSLLSLLRSMASHSIGERHPITLSLDAELPAVLLDRSGFESAMLNLLVNSRDAMPDGGQITISTSLNRLRPGSSGVAAHLPPGTYVCVSVADEGIGIAPELQERVFEPFFTTKPIGQGTGLGLSTAAMSS